MKKSLTLLTFVVLFYGAAIAQIANKDVLYETKSLRDLRVGTVVAETTGGSVSVTAIDDKESRVEVYINNREGKLSADSIKKILSTNYSYYINVRNHRLIITAQKKNNDLPDDKQLMISLKIYVPKDVNATVVTSEGDITLTNLSGEHDITTSGGGLYINSVAGRVEGKTSGGSIFVADSKCNLFLSTSGGDINAKNSAGTISLVTSGGSVNIEKLAGHISAVTSGMGAITCKDITGDLTTCTNNGDITLAGVTSSVEAATSVGNVNAEFSSLEDETRLITNKGNINITLPKSTNANLDIVAKSISTPQSANFTGQNQKGIMRGILNNGGTPLMGVSGQGQVNVKFP